MAIEINTMRVPITAEMARDIISRHTNEFGIFIDQERINELYVMYNQTNIRITIQIGRLAQKRLANIDDNQIKRLLIAMGVNESEFVNIETGKPSFAKPVRERLLKNPALAQEIKDILILYNGYVENKTRMSFLNSYMQYRLCNNFSYNNRRMSVLHPQWRILNTGRIQAFDPNIQQIPREIPDIITAPKGYTLLRCDSGQIEPRINFSTFLRDEIIFKLIMYYQDAYWGLYHYCILQDNELAALNENFDANFKPIEITEEMKPMRQNIKRLTNAGSYGSTNLDGINPSLANAYERRIVKHPKRIALQQQVRESVQHGNNTFYGMFGTPVTPDETQKYAPGSSGWVNHVIRCGINNPVQATASELMLFSVDRANQILSKSKSSHICFYKHDEACFYISDEDMAAGIGKELEDVTAYNVKDWIPIPNEPEYGVKKGSMPTLMKG